MGDSLSIVFTIILAVLIMFLFPMMDTFERQDDLSYMAVYTATVDFVDAVRNTGTLTMDMYNSFLSQIQSTGNLFDVTLEHREYKVVPAGAGTVSTINCIDAVNILNRAVEDDVEREVSSNLITASNSNGSTVYSADSKDYTTKTVSYSLSYDPVGKVGKVTISN